MIPWQLVDAQLSDRGVTFDFVCADVPAHNAAVQALLDQAGANTAASAQFAAQRDALFQRIIDQIGPQLAEVGALTAAAAVLDGSMVLETPAPSTDPTDPSPA